MPMQSADPLPEALLDSDRLRAALAAGEPAAPLCRTALEHADAWLDQQFLAGHSIRELIRLRARVVDTLLQQLWERHAWPGDDICLVAVGGYGRSELHPHSDIDLLILLTDEHATLYHRTIERFVTELWDLHLNIGHSVRTLTECCTDAAADVTIVTSLMESRPLAGHSSLYKHLVHCIRPPGIWTSPDFFRAKWAEQEARHHKYGDTGYSLEPNVKHSPGGLRDIQTVGWVAKRHFGARHLQELLERGFLLDDELALLKRGQDYLWRVRYALHHIAGRCEDRLLFDHQRTLARMFGYRDDDTRLAVERFMQQYYRWVLAIGELNELLMQHYEEIILRADEPEELIELNPRFRVRNGYIEACHDQVFADTPSALLEIFVLMGSDARIRGVRAATVRLIREYRTTIDERFRCDPRNNHYFLQLLNAPHRMIVQLQRMKRYGVLGHYLPEFGQVIGQMQHDLFHIYTVDAHTLEVIKNMQGLLQPDVPELFTLAARVIRQLPRIDLLYIAGLYHDIGKGRGGDHSLLGAQDAARFCRQHGLPRRDARLVVWLVKQHLLMSTVAQRQDISDPDVIHRFARAVGDQRHLDYLYVLTVADIHATNPTLWNGWRASLLSQLYTATLRALRRGLEHPVDRQEWIEESQESALALLLQRGQPEARVRELWAHIGDDYFMREKVDDIVWHTEAMACHADSAPLVLIKSSPEHPEGATQIFIRAREHASLFAVLAADMEHLELSVQDARLYSATAGYVLYTFFVLDADGGPIGDDASRIAEIRSNLMESLHLAKPFPEIIRRRTPRQLRLFSTPTETHVFQHPGKPQTVLEVITPDRPGLLARIGRIFVEHGIQLQNAKITTLGARVEDVFFITDLQGHPIHEQSRLDAIQTAIRSELDQQAAI